MPPRSPLKRAMRRKLLPLSPAILNDPLHLFQPRVAVDRLELILPQPCHLPDPGLDSPAASASTLISCLSAHTGCILALTESGELDGGPRQGAFRSWRCFTHRSGEAEEVANQSFNPPRSAKNGVTGAHSIRRCGNAEATFVSTHFLVPRSDDIPCDDRSS